MGLWSAEVTGAIDTEKHWFAPPAVFCLHFIFETSGRS